MPEEKKIKTISINGGEVISFDKFMDIIERELDQRSLRRIERERRAEEDRLGLK